MSLIKAIDFLLKKRGIFVFEEPYLGSMYKKTSYDQIYDEHIYMFSVSSISKIFKKFGFELIDVIEQDTHSGSMRYVLSRKNVYKVKPSVNRKLNYEIKKNINSIKGCMEFKKKCENSKKNLLLKLKNFKKKGKTIAGYAATSKSTTILNYCKIGPNIIDYICDTTKEKVGRFSPGTHIPIVSLSHFHKNLPDVTYLFAWNHREEIFAKEKDFVRRGGKWISHDSI